MSGKTHAKKAAQAHSNLNIYYAVIRLLEGGLLYDDRHETATRIISLCKQQAAEELVIYDTAMEKIP